ALRCSRAQPSARSAALVRALRSRSFGQLRRLIDPSIDCKPARPGTGSPFCAVNSTGGRQVRKPIALLSAALLAAFVVAGVRFAHAGRQQAAKACPSGYMTPAEVVAADPRAAAGEAGGLSGGSLHSARVPAKHR